MKDLDKVALHYNDSRDPGRVKVVITTNWPTTGSRVTLDLTAAETATLAGRLLEAVHASGLVLTAKKRAA